MATGNSSGALQVTTKYTKLIGVYLPANDYVISATELVIHSSFSSAGWINCSITIDGNNAASGDLWLTYV